MIKHILHIIWNERKHNAGIWLEFFLVFVFLWFIMDFVYVTVGIYTKPLGFDTQHTYIMRLGILNENSPEFKKEDSVRIKVEHLLTIQERIQHNPLVESASLSFHSSPHIGSNRSRHLYRDTFQTNYSVLERTVTPDFFKVFRYKSKSGSTDELVQAAERNEFVISESVEKQLFPDGESAVGKYISLRKDDSITYRVGAVSKEVRYDNFTPWNLYFARSFSNDRLEIFTGDNINALEICVRVKPEEDRDFINRFRTDMTEPLRIGNYYLSTIQSIPENKKIYQRDDLNNLRIRMFIIFFLLLNIFLGITGTFWFRTQHRKGEIGLRVALGDTQEKILLKYYAEGIILLTSAMIPAAFVMYIFKTTGLLTYHDTLTAGRFFIGLGITYLLLAGMIVLGIWFPARKTVNVPPAEALRDE